MTVPYTGHSREGAAPARRALGWRDAFNVIREVSGNRPIITMVALAGCVSFFVGTAFQATMPEFAHDLGTEKADFAYSALLAANAAGAVFGGFLLEGPRLVAAAGQHRDDQRDSLVYGDRRLCAVDQLLFIAGAAFYCRRVEPDFFFDGTDHRAACSPPQLRGRLIGLFSMASMGLKAFSGVTVGVARRLDRRALVARAASAMVLLTVTVALFAFTMPAERQGSSVKATADVNIRRVISSAFAGHIILDMTMNPVSSRRFGVESRKESRFRRAAPSRLSTLFHRQFVFGDGRQYRACHQLLAALSEISLAGARPASP